MRRLRRRDPVDDYPVGGTRIANEPAGFIVQDLGMMARDARIANDDVAVGVATDDRAVVTQLVHALRLEVVEDGLRLLRHGLVEDDRALVGGRVINGKTLVFGTGDWCRSRRRSGMRRPDRQSRPWAARP